MNRRVFRTILPAAVPFAVALAAPAAAQSDGAAPQPATQVVLRGTTDATIGPPERVSVEVPERLTLRGVLGAVRVPDRRRTRGTVTLHARFDGSAVSARVSGTGGLLPDSVFGTAENGVCHLSNAEGTSVWEGPCDPRGFSGTFRSPAARGMMIEGRFTASPSQGPRAPGAPPAAPPYASVRDRRSTGPVRLPYDSAALPDLSPELRGRVARLYGVSPASFAAKRPVWSGYMTLEEYADGRRKYEWLLYFLCMDTQAGCLTDASFAHTHVAIYEPARNKLYVGSRRDTASLWCREAPARVCNRSRTPGGWRRPGPDIDVDWTLAALAIASRRADSHALLARCLQRSGERRSWLVETRDGYGSLVDSRIDSQEWLELRNTCDEPLFIEMADCSFFLWYDGPFSIYPGSSRRVPVNAAGCRVFALTGLRPF
jgi:hypothetical protein